MTRETESAGELEPKLTHPRKTLLGALLRSIRKEKKLSQWGLAGQARLSRSLIDQLERGVKGPRTENTSLETLSST